MKNKIHFLIIAIIVIFIPSCSDDTIDEIDFSVNNSSPKVGEKVTFQIKGNAETFVIFTGDATHDFENSHIALTSGQDLDQELVVLPLENLPDVKNTLNWPVSNHNQNNPSSTLNLDDLVQAIEDNIVGKEYTSIDTAQFEVYNLLFPLPRWVTNNVVNSHFDNNSTILAPVGGFSTGFAVDRFSKTLEYTYSASGTYVVTLIATGVSGKVYTGSGYQDDRTASGDEYELNRVYRELVITVQP